MDIFDILNLPGGIESLTVSFAVAKYIEKAGPTPAQQLARAQAIKGVVTELEGVLTGSVTIAQLQAITAADITSHITDPADQALAQGLLTLIVSDLNIKVGTGVLQSAAVGVVTQMANYVLAACALYGA